MNGSGFIASGTYGCVHKPPVKCEGNVDKKKKYYNKTVGKVFRDSSNAEQESTLNDIIAKIDPANKWTVQMQKKCFVDSFDETDEKDACHFVSKNIQQYPELIYTYGGVDLNTIMKTDEVSNVKRRNIFIKIFKSILPVLEGLRDLNNRNNHHLDIKPENVLFDGKVLRIVDFGLMDTRNNIYTKKKMFLLKHNYPYYPPEFKLYAFTSTKKTAFSQFEKFVENWNDDQSIPSNLEQQYESFYSSIKTKLKSMTQTHIKNEIEKYASKIDVYSLGVTLEKLYKTLVWKNNLLTTKFENIINNMTTLNIYTRFDWDEIINAFKQI